MSHAVNLRRRYKNAKNDAFGMTLIELMIAIAIASTLAVAGYRALASLTSSATQLTATTQRWQALDAHAAAVERAYRRIAPGSAVQLTANTLALTVLGDAGASQPLKFGEADEHVRAWQFAAWDGAQWVSDWRANTTPRGLKITLTTAQGETVERTYAQ
jgi:prepilin-type N-terminal cleavage/methylation domain-containing protein